MPIPPFVATVRDRLVAADPGLVRLLLAARVTVAVALTVIVLALGSAEFAAPPTIVVVGAIVAMQGLLAVTDPRSRTTTLLAPIPAIVGVVIGALCSPYPAAADLVFLAVLFTAVAIRARGPRWTAFGTIAMMTYFLALFVHVTIANLPAFVIAVIAALALSFFVRFVVLRDRPRWLARRIIDAFDARIRLVAVAAKDLLESHDPAVARRRLTVTTQRLNETAAAIESRLGPSATAELRIIFDAELAAEELAAEAQILRDAGVAPPRVLVLALGALGRGRADRAARVAGRSAAQSGFWHPAARGLAAAIIDLGETIVRVDAAAELLALSDAPWGGGPGAQQPALRQAIQVTAASAVAIAVGEAISPQRWYWAVITTYFVFSGTASSGETFARAWSRIGGTALGVAAGVIFAHFAKGHPGIDLGALFVCLFMCVYVQRVSYLMMVFFLTALLALLYTLMGSFSDEVLAIRLLETALGAICGGIAATLILPTRTRDVVRESAHAALNAAQAVVHASIERLIEPQDANDTLDAARVLEERVEAFVARAKPAISVPVLLGRGHELRRWIVSLSACSYYGRMLARIADRSKLPASPATRTTLETLDAEITTNIHAAAERIYGRHQTRSTSTLAHFDALRTAAGDDLQTLASAAHLLERLDRTIARLARDEGTITEPGLATDTPVSA